MSPQTKASHWARVTGRELLSTGRLDELSKWFYGAAGVLALCVIISSNTHAHALKHAAELNGFGTKATHLGESFLEGLTFGQYDAASRREADYTHTIEEANKAAGTSLLASIALAILAGAFVWHVHTVGSSVSGNGTQLVVRHLCYTSLILFVVGIAAMALGLIAYKEVPVLGRVVFKFEAKGIASTIGKLFSSGNAILGLLIFLFSIAVPLAKVALMLFATYATGQSREDALGVIKAVGKWSMADVFVVAVLLAMFAIGGDETTDAFTGPGIYFFAAYCILSMWAGVVLHGTQHHLATEVPTSAACVIVPPVGPQPPVRLPAPKDVLARFAPYELRETIAEVFGGPSQPTVPTRSLQKDWRQWTSADGSRAQEAAFESCTTHTVTVLTRGGKRARIPLDKLSAEDREYVRAKGLETTTLFEEVPEDESI